MKKKLVIYVFLLMACLLPYNLFAQDAQSQFKTANTYYQNKQYQEAEKIYLLLLQKEKNNINAYYNLGNTYFHLKQYAQAVYYYEKALKLQPNNKYILHNISETNNRLFSKIEFDKEFFVIKQIKSFLQAKTATTWSIYMLVALWIGAFCMAVHLLFSNKLLYKTGVMAMIAAVLLAFITYSVYNNTNEQKTAIVLQPNAFIKNTPVESTNAATAIQTGLKVEIIDTDKDWMKIKLPNGKTGWIESDNLGII